MKLITLLIFLSILPSGLMAQKKVFDKTANQQKIADLKAKSSASRESLTEASTNYQVSLEKLLIPLCERYEIVFNDLEKKRKLLANNLILASDVSITDAETELAFVKQSIVETNNKIKESEALIAEIQNQPEPTPADITRRERAYLAEAAREEREPRRPSGRYFVGIFIAKEIIPARKIRKPRRK